MSKILGLRVAGENAGPGGAAFPVEQVAVGVGIHDGSRKVFDDGFIAGDRDFPTAFQSDDFARRAGIEHDGSGVVEHGIHHGDADIFPERGEQEEIGFVEDRPIVIAG